MQEGGCGVVSPLMGVEGLSQNTPAPTPSTSLGVSGWESQAMGAVTATAPVEMRVTSRAKEPPPMPV